MEPPSPSAALLDLGNGGEQVLGAANAQQMQLRWREFVEGNGDLLRSRCACPPEGVQPTSCPAERPTFASAETDATMEELQRLGLDCSMPEGSLVAGLAGTVLEARRCISGAQSHIAPLALFGKRHKQQDGAATNPELLAELSELLPKLQVIEDHLQRAAELGQHLVQQMLAIQVAATARDGRLGGRSLSVSPLLDLLGEVLAVAALADGLFNGNQRFGQSHANLTWIVSKAMEEGPKQLQLPEDAASQLLEQLKSLEAMINGSSVEVCLRRILSGLQGTCSQDCPAALREQIMTHCRAKLKQAESSAAVRLPGESLVPWVCCFTLFMRIWRPGSSESRLLADILKMGKHTPAVAFHGRAWCASEFLARHLPAMASVSSGSMTADELKAQRQRQASRLDLNGCFVQEMLKSRASVLAWLASLGPCTTALATAGGIRQALRDFPRVLLQGVSLALAVRSALEEYIVLHVHEAVPVVRGSLQGVSLGFQLLDVLAASLCGNPCFIELSVLLQQHAALRLSSRLEEIAAKLGQRAADRQSARLLGFSKTALFAVLEGGPSELLDFRFDLGSLALCFAGQAELLSPGPGGLWREFKDLCQWQRLLAHFCDTTWSIAARQLFPELLASLRGKGKGMQALPRLCHAFAKALGAVMEVNGELGGRYLRDLQKALDSGVVSPLAALVEEDLRRHTHAVAQAQLESLPEATSSRREMSSALSLGPLLCSPTVIVDVKDEIELRLSKMFYDLTALAPQLAETYGRMRSLASERYGLELLDGRLPRGSLDHGLDVIDIMRNVHQFAAQYSYSLHQQLFIQSSNQGDVKVRIIAMEHVATSLQMHGTGIINTMVNYIYGYLRRKLEVVVEFLNDEAVKSRMLTDKQWLVDQRTYTWSRAVETARFVRKLGVSKDGHSFLDKLRQVVTQIGNSLGYLRLVRAAGMRSIAGSLPFADAGNFHSAQSVDLGQDQAISAAQSLVAATATVADEARSSAQRCFEVSSDYLHLLAEFFAAGMSNASQSSDSGSALASSPTRLFHLLAPALTESFMHSVLTGREALAKRALTSATSKRSNAFFSDDGFALGLVWILRVFRLDQEFETMHWFEAEIQDVGFSEFRDEGRSNAFADGSRGIGSRQELLQKELKRLAATVEAASSLLGAFPPG